MTYPRAIWYGVLIGLMSLIFLFGVGAVLHYVGVPAFVAISIAMPLSWAVASAIALFFERRTERNHE